MRDTTLPSPGKYGYGPELRRLAAQTISAVELAAAKTPGGKTQSAATLATFFTACASSLTAISDATAPAVSAAQTPNAAPATIVVTLDSPLDQTVVPPVSAFAASGGKTVSSVTVAGDGLSITITVDSAYVNGNTITASYTAPALSYLRDLAGNALPSFADLAVTNNVA